MKRKFLTAAVLSVGLSTVTLPTHALNLFGLFSKDKEIDNMLEHVPADSLMVLAGQNNAKLNDEVSNWLQSIGYTDPTDFDALFSEFGDGAGIATVSWLFEDYYNTYSQDPASIRDHYGIKDDGAFLAYTDGLFPVLRIELDNEKTFPALLKKAAAANDYELTEESIGEASMYTFLIADESDFQMSLGVLVQDKKLTVSMFTQHDDAQEKLERFALVDIKGSVAQERWKDDGKTYGFDEYLRGYLDFVSVAKAFYNKDHKAHQQLAEIMGKEEMTYFYQSFEPQCQADIMGLVSESPRLVFGSTNQSLKNKKVEVDFNTLLELKNADVTTNLAKLRGFLPSYLSRTDLALGVGVGLDMNQLVPVATALWTQFTEKEFSCQALQQMQADVKEMNPAVIAMGTAMMQGMTGFSFGLFDLEADGDNPMASKIDAIMSLTAKQPQVLASMATQFVPFLGGVVLPEDGSPVNLKSDMMPLDIYAMSKGEHLVLYTGDNAASVAAELVEEKVTPNGVISATLNYSALGQTVFNTMTDTDYLAGLGDSCTDFYTSALLFKGLPFNLSLNADFSKLGYENIYSFKGDLSTQHNQAQSLKGLYQLSYLDYDCTWQQVGQENLKKDNTGEYFEMDDTGSCRTYEGTYKWSEAARSLEQSDSAYRYRETCDGEWQDEADPENFSCKVFAKDDTGFYCLYSTYDDKTLYRYERQE